MASLNFFLHSPVLPRTNTKHVPIVFIRLRERHAAVAKHLMCLRVVSHESNFGRASLIDSIDEFDFRCREQARNLNLRNSQE